MAVNATSAGVTTTSSGACATDTAALPLAPPDVAVTVADPLPAAVTSPVLSTDATEASDEDQDTAAPDMTLPFWSRTSATNCTVSPMAAKATDVGVTVTVVATGGGGGGGSGGSVAESPHESVRGIVATKATNAKRGTARVVKARRLIQSLGNAGRMLNRSRQVA